MRILIPPGIGDIYWILTKIEAFCKKHGESEKPVMTVLKDHSAVWDEAYLRGIPFLEMCPLVRVSDPASFPLDPVMPRPANTDLIYTEAFNKRGRTVFPGFHGFDYFMNYNGIINSGNWLETCDDLTCDWYPELIISDEQRRFQEQCLERHGRYVVFYWIFSNKHIIENHLAQFPTERLAAATRVLCETLGTVPIFLGAFWDLTCNRILSDLISKVPDSVNLVGQTFLDQALGVIRGAEMVVGYHSGLTNLAIMMRKKTVLLWPSGKVFQPSVPLAVAPPDTRNTTYHPMCTENLTVGKLVRRATEIYEQG